MTPEPTGSKDILIIFDTSKNELFQIDDHYKSVYRKLKLSYKVETNSNEISLGILKRARLFIVAGPQEKFTEDELKAMKDYIEGGGRIITLLGEGGENDFPTNINFLLEDFGMTINSDFVMRPQYYKYFHPKECMISGGVVSQSLAQYILNENYSSIPFDFSDEKMKIQFVYPFGATLNVAPPSNALVTTGSVCYPFNRALIGYYCNDLDGKIVSIGSGHMFQDKYITENSNLLIWDYIIKLMIHNEIKFSSYDFSEVEINDNILIPDLIFLAEQPKFSLVESIDCDIPSDFKKLFDMRLYGISNHLLKEVINTYEKLSVQYEPLKIIKPQFEIPLPPLQLAVFQPSFSELSNPPLELFDLEDALRSEKSQITMLTNKCLDPTDAKHKKPMVEDDEKQLEYYIQECGRIMNVYPETQVMSAKDILYNICVKIAQYKNVERD